MPSSPETLSGFLNEILRGISNCTYTVYPWCRIHKRAFLCKSATLQSLCRQIRGPFSRARYEQIGRPYLTGTLTHLRKQVGGRYLTVVFILGPTQVARPPGAAGPAEHRAGGVIVVVEVAVAAAAAEAAAAAAAAAAASPVRFQRP